MSDINKKKKKKEKDERPKVSVFKVIGFGLKVHMTTIPVVFIIANILHIFHGAAWGFSTFITQQVYDSVADIITKNETVEHAFLMISVLGLTAILKHVINGVVPFLRHDVVDGKSNGEMAKIIHEKMAHIDPVCFEDTKFHDDINKASEGAGAVLDTVSTIIDVFCYYGAYFVFMGFYLHHLKPQFIIAIVLVFMPIALSQVIRTGIIAKFEDKAAPVRRQYNYFNETITSREYYKETRILGAYRFFLEHFLDMLKKLSKAELQANIRTNFLELCMNLISAAGYAGIMYMLVTALLAGEITVGAFAAVFNSIGMLLGMMRELINFNIGNVAANMGKAHNFIRFMEMPERSGDNATPNFKKGIIAENVNFTYPHAENKSVDNVSLEIKDGETLAIVGENGAGKTTLVRLLMGLYIPTEGKVVSNGMDTSKINCKSLFCDLSGVFQKFQRYQMTLKENIQISDIDKNIDIGPTAEQAGVNMNSASFPDGAETMLSREFEGVDLSGGEWQRVAIARGLYRVHNLVVLDEPTAAIDPIEESRIYQKFVEISKDKTAVIVTHRLGSTKIADRVVVMDKGRIVDIGSHNELMSKKCLYAEMFNSQAAWYTE